MSLQNHVNAALKSTGVPGLVAGTDRGGDIETAAAGTRNLNTGDPMTVDTGFLTGSITKVWCATLAMTFVDEGLLDLDAPVREYLPDFEVADADVSKKVRVQHLLNHTTGWDAGDLALELGEGNASYERTLDILRNTGQVHPLGQYVSYNNSNYPVLALVLSSLSDGTEWSQLLRDRVIKPMGLTRTVTTTDEAILHATAVGSLATGPGGAHEATRFMLLPKSMAPAGSTLFTTVGDSLQFLRMHLDDGMAPNGTRVISPESAIRMRTPTTTEAIPSTGVRVGLSWMIAQRDGRVMCTHNGGSYGGIASAAIVPDRDLAIISFGNSAVVGAVSTAAVHAAVLRGDYPPAGALPVEDRMVDLDAFVGTFRRAGVRLTVDRDGDELVVDHAIVPEEYQVDASYSAGTRDFEPVRVSPENWNRLPGPTVFLDPDATGRFRYLSAGGRVHKRI